MSITIVTAVHCRRSLFRAFHPMAMRPKPEVFGSALVAAHSLAPPVSRYSTAIAGGKPVAATRGAVNG